MDVSAAFTVFLALICGIATAHAADWKVGPWYGDPIAELGACSATFVDTRQNNSFSLSRYQKNSFTTKTTKLYMVFIDDAADENRFDGLVGKSVKLSVGPTFRASGKVVERLIHTFEFEVPASVLDALAAGGTWSLKLPSGKGYRLNLPAAAPAIANFRKCLLASGMH